MAIRVPYTHGYYRALNVLAFVTYFMWWGIVWWALPAIWDYRCAQRSPRRASCSPPHRDLRR